MATRTFTVIADKTLAGMNTWGPEIGATLTAFGWVQTADAGQCTFPVAATNGNNYQIWRMADGLHGTLPVHLRITYGGATSNVAWLKAQIGLQGTDGAGNLSGSQISPVFDFGTSTVPTAGVSALSIASGDTNRLVIPLWINHATATVSSWLSIERAKDAAGADSANGVIFAAGRNTSFVQMLYLPATGGVPKTETKLPSILSNSADASGSFGLTVGLGVVIPLAGSAQNPGLNLLTHLQADFTRDTQHMIAMYGVNRNYYIIGPNVDSVAGAGGAASANSRLAVRYE